MFVQQPVRIVATPTATQEVGVKLDSLLRMHYSQRAKTMVSDNIRVLRLEPVASVLVEGNTQVDYLFSVEFESLDELDAFLRSFFPRETTDDFVVIDVVLTML